MAEDRYLEGRVAWVTGGASGIGRASAIALARAGAGVASARFSSEKRRRPSLDRTLTCQRKTTSRRRETRSPLSACGY